MSQSGLAEPYVRRGRPLMRVSPAVRDRARREWRGRWRSGGTEMAKLWKLWGPVHHERGTLRKAWHSPAGGDSPVCSRGITEQLRAPGERPEKFGNNRQWFPTADRRFRRLFAAKQRIPRLMRSLQAAKHRQPSPVQSTPMIKHILSSVNQWSSSATQCQNGADHWTLRSVQSTPKMKHRLTNVDH